MVLFRSVHLEAGEEIKSLAMSFDRIAELSFLPWAGSDDVGSDAIQDALHLPLNSIGVSRKAVAVEQEHSLIHVLGQNKSPSIGAVGLDCVCRLNWLWTVWW